MTTKSLFGGPLSTRAACMNFDMIERLKQQEEAATAARLKKANANKQQQQQNGNPRPSPPPQPAPPPAQVKREKLRQDLELFDDLNDESGRPPGAAMARPRSSTPPSASGAGPAKQGQEAKQAQPVRRGPPLKSLPSAPSKLASAGKGGAAATSTNGINGARHNNGAGGNGQAGPRQLPGDVRVAAQPGSSGPGRPLAAKPGTGVAKAQAPGSRPLSAPPPPQPSASGHIGRAPPPRAPPSLQGRMQAPPGGRSVGTGSAGAGQQGPGHRQPPPGQGHRRMGPAPGRGHDPNPSRRRPMHYDEDEYDLDGFVVDDDEEPDWQGAIRRLTGYNPNRYPDADEDDRAMVSGYRALQAEEKRSERMGRAEDEVAEEEERRRLLAKQNKLKAAKKQRTN